jgi:hypothetical protein
LRQHNVVAGNSLCEFDKAGGNVLIFTGTNTYTGIAPLNVIWSVLV